MEDLIQKWRFQTSDNKCEIHSNKWNFNTIVSTCVFSSSFIFQNLLGEPAQRPFYCKKEAALTPMFVQPQCWTQKEVKKRLLQGLVLLFLFSHIWAISTLEF